MKELLLEPGITQIIALLILFAILILSLFVLEKNISSFSESKTSLKCAAVSVFVFAVEYFFSVRYIKVFGYGITEAYMKIPMWIVWVFIVICLILLVLEMKNINKTIVLDNSSVKEALDKMSVAVCYFDSDGEVRLCNNAMRMLYLEMTGKEVSNIFEFKKDLNEALKRSGWKQKITGKELFLLLGKKAYSYEEHIITDNKGREFTEEKLSDFTEFYETGSKLDEQTRSLKEMSYKLKDLSDDAIELIRQNEILSAKMKLHDQMGAGLVAVRMLLVSNGSEEEEKQAINILKSAVNVLKNDNDYHMGREKLEDILWNAKAVGVDVRLEGKLPENRVIADIFLMAIQEALTNSVKHGYATAMSIIINNTSEENSITISNNGVLPSKKISPKGGLHNLNSYVNNLGGEMIIEAETEVTLKISIPIKNGE